MTVEEFSLEFDILYNNIKSQLAPGLDEYEKSVFLTQAQRIFINEIIKDGVEKTEFNRRVLEKLIVQASLTLASEGEANSADANINTSSIFYKAPEDLLRITYEVLGITVESVSKAIKVVPIRQDEYSIQINNPFKKPKAYGLSTLAWRMDYGGENVSTLEIIPPENVTINSYKIRYIKQPSPIILVDLTTIDPTLTIEGLNGDGTPASDVPITCQLNEDAHLPILNIAVGLAEKAYKV